MKDVYAVEAALNRSVRSCAAYERAVPSRIYPVGTRTVVDGVMVTIKEHNRTHDDRTVIVTYWVEGRGFNTYVVEDQP